MSSYPAAYSIPVLPGYMIPNKMILGDRIVVPLHRDACRSILRRKFVDFQTTMKRDELLEKLRDNRTRHRKMYEESVAGYCNKAANQCQEMLNRLSDGESIVVQSTLQPPEDHTSDYDRILRMLQCTQQDEITLDEEQFSCYVDDDWNWIGGWLQRNREFSTSAFSYATEKKLK